MSHKPSVDDDGPIPIQTRRTLGVQLLERQVERVLEVRLVILSLGQDLDELSVVLGD